ncbi:hypothetical protein DV738_g5688, partial [Chaetothyriales sp. CBS 135597]
RAGTNLMPYRSNVVELMPTPLERRALHNISQTWFSKLYKGGGGKSDGNNDGGSLRDMKVHHTMSISTTNTRLYHIISKVGALADQCTSWTTKYNDRGATFYFKTVRAEPTYLVYPGRWELLSFIASSSVKLRYVCRILYRCLYGDGSNAITAHSPQKLLVFMNWPVEQWELGFFLHLLGIPFLELRSGQSVQEKEATIAQFNDPADTATILITTFKATSAIGRVHRLGQTNNQDIWILGIVGSYDEYVQARICNKFKAQILGEANIKKKKWTDADLRKIRDEETNRDPDGSIDER